MLKEKNLTCLEPCADCRIYDVIVHSRVLNFFVYLENSWKENVMDSMQFNCTVLLVLE